MAPKTSKPKVRKSVERWLEEGGHDYTELDEGNEKLQWHFSLSWPVYTSWNLDLVCPANETDCIQVFATVDVNENHQDSLRQCTLDERKTFHDDLIDALLSDYTLFSIFVADPEEQPGGEERIIERFMVEGRIYQDGLTKTAFYEKLLQVHSTRTKGVRVFQKWFGRDEQQEDTETR